MSKIKVKIEKLLAKAEGTDNAAEREAYTAKAQALMLEWGIESADLEARGEVKPEEIVEVRKTWNSTYAVLWPMFVFSVARGMGNLRTLKSGTKMRHSAFVIGHKTDVENLWMLMDSLEVQANHALAQWWKDAEERQWGLSAHEQYKIRRAFLLAFGDECGRRLRAQRVQVHTEATPGAALVLVSKADRVDAWTGEKYPSLRKGSSLANGASGTRAGRAAGSRANLGRSIGNRQAVTS